MKPFPLILLALSLAYNAHAAELFVDVGHGITRYQTTQLLRRADVRTIIVPEDVTFHRTMHYRAVPLMALLEDVSVDDYLQFVASDGFTAEIPAVLIMKQHGSKAWLAVEDPARAWPVLGKADGDAGPFYIVWTHPQAAGISPEQWPYKLTMIRKLGDIATRFPAILPDPALPPDSEVRRGFALFQHTCFACHTMNGEGDARLGPDLNLPHNPTEYLRGDLLRAFIRNPQSLRRWPQAKMTGLDRQALSDAELDAVLAYLRHMAGRKPGH